MRINEGESYESWSERVRMYEHGWAMQRIAEGQPPEKVLEEMGERIMQKLLHPIFKAIRETSTTDYDAEKSRKEYEEKYLKHHTPVADHVEGQIFDNNEKK